MFPSYFAWHIHSFDLQELRLLRQGQHGNGVRILGALVVQGGFAGKSTVFFSDKFQLKSQLMPGISHCHWLPRLITGGCSVPILSKSLTWFNYMRMHFNLNFPLNRLWDQTLNEGVINTHGWKPALSVIYLDMIYLSVYIYTCVCIHIYISVLYTSNIYPCLYCILCIYIYIWLEIWFWSSTGPSGPVPKGLQNGRFRVGPHGAVAELGTLNVSWSKLRL